MLFEVRFGGGGRSSGWDTQFGSSRCPWPFRSDTFGLWRWIHKKLSRAVWNSALLPLSISVSNLATSKLNSLIDGNGKIRSGNHESPDQIFSLDPYGSTLRGSGAFSQQAETAGVHPERDSRTGSGRARARRQRRLRRSCECRPQRVRPDRQVGLRSR